MKVIWKGCWISWILPKWVFSSWWKRYQQENSPNSPMAQIKPRASCWVASCWVHGAFLSSDHWSYCSCFWGDVSLKLEASFSGSVVPIKTLMQDVRMVSLLHHLGQPENHGVNCFFKRCRDSGYQKCRKLKKEQSISQFFDQTNQP